MDKFFIIGIRYNPQLGSYLSKGIIAKPKVNKKSISVSFEEYGSKTSLKFGIDYGRDGRHYQLGTNDCVYGSYSYYGFHSKEDAINELKTWENVSGSSADRAKAYMKAFQEA